MKTQNIAIIGAGTAGLAAAAMLAAQGHQICLYEKVSQLEPVGAGLLLQPAGLAVFEHLGILEHALSLGAVVTGLEGQLAGGDLLINSHYRQADERSYGLGIHRATLCHVLASKVREYPQHVEWCMAHEVHELQESCDGINVIGQSADQSFQRQFDLVLIANGARSHLRPKAWEKLNQAYPWGAKWIIVPECEVLNPQILHQFYDCSNIMMGVMPTGAIPTQPEQRLSSIFWSLPTADLEGFLKTKSAQQQWLLEVSKRWPSVAEWLAHVIPHPDDPQQWLSANYRDVVLSKLGEDRIGILGDAAHAMSPQLGQGANMALLDAWAISHALLQYQQDSSLQNLWQQYHQLRLPSVRFYQFFSRLLTPFYQSHHRWTAPLRDISFRAMYQLPFFRKEMAITISGLKTGAFGQMNYADIARKPADDSAAELRNLKFD
ncbi:FAD-dependent oxidoreductase [Acinetobacter amyesii]|uniref:FAD-dependent oxidoreductase n=1 Tax=Acinetobacter amyesii TaxID=2942470 RepID=UPI003F075F42